MNAMLTLMAGLLIVALDFEVSIGGIAINIISDIIGHFIIIFSAKKLIPWSPCFKKTIKHGILGAIFYLGYRISINMGAVISLQLFFSGFGAIFYIYMTYYIMEGLVVKNKMEKMTEPNGNLKGSWVAMAIVAFAYCFASLMNLQQVMIELGVPGLDNIILLVLNGAVLITTVFFVMVLNQNRMLLLAKQEKGN